MKKALFGVGTLALTFLFAFWGVFLRDVNRAGPFLGTTVGGYLPDPKIRYADWLQYEKSRRGASTLTLHGDGKDFEITFRQIGIVVDVQAMENQAERQRHSGGTLNRLVRWLEAKYSRQNLVFLTEFDATVARGELQRIATFVEQPSVNAEVDLIRRRRIKARTGRRLDIDATLERLDRLRDIEMADFELVIREVIPQVTEERLTLIDFDKVLSSFETDFRTRAGPRAVNIRVAARALNGYVISPNEVFSFNRVIGPRTENRGYREAPVIVDDELEPGVGGGVCQVATTLHAAIVLAGFEVMERRSHSRPSGYAPMGLDATVLDGGVDLKFRNPYRIPLLIATNFPDRFRLRIEVLGMLPTKKLKHTYHVKKKYDFYRRLITKYNLPFGSYERKQKGNFGYDVESTIQAIDGGDESKLRQYRSKYWPVPEVYWIGPDTELNQLPALPDGAIGVQRDGVTVFGNIPKDVEERTMNGGGDDFDNPGGV